MIAALAANQRVRRDAQARRLREQQHSQRAARSAGSRHHLHHPRTYATPEERERDERMRSMHCGPPRGAASMDWVRLHVYQVGGNLYLRPASGTIDASGAALGDQVRAVCEEASRTLFQLALPTGWTRWCCGADATLDQNLRTIPGRVVQMRLVRVAAKMRGSDVEVLAMSDCDNVQGSEALWNHEFYLAAAGTSLDLCERAAAQAAGRASALPTTIVTEATWPAAKAEVVMAAVTAGGDADGCATEVAAAVAVEAVT